MRNKLINAHCKRDTESPDVEELEIMADMLSKPIVWHTPVEDQGQLAQSHRIEGIVIGKLTNSETIEVNYPGNPMAGSISAIATCAVKAGDINREVALTFQDTDPLKPILLGFIHHPQHKQQSTESPSENQTQKSIDVNLDGEQLIFSAKKEIVLKCGKASIMLTRAGKIVLRGVYLLSRSSGINRIKGGSVQIN